MRESIYSHLSLFGAQSEDCTTLQNGCKQGIILAQVVYDNSFSRVQLYMPQSPFLLAHCIIHAGGSV